MQQSGEVPASHSLDVARLGELFEYLLNGQGKRNLNRVTWEFTFVRALHQQWKKGGVGSLTQDSLMRLERIYVRC
jgi:hypothetical protein